MDNSINQNNSQYVFLEQRLTKLEAENKKLKDLFDSLFSGSTDTKLYLKRQIAIDKQALIGFYGKDPIKQQSVASDTLANLYTALRAYGLIQ